MILLLLFLTSFHLISLAPTSGATFLQKHIERSSTSAAPAAASTSASARLNMESEQISSEDGAVSEESRKHILSVANSPVVIVYTNRQVNENHVVVTQTVEKESTQQRREYAALGAVIQESAKKTGFFILTINPDNGSPEYQKDEALQNLFDIQQIGENKFLFKMKTLRFYQEESQKNPSKNLNAMLKVCLLVAKENEESQKKKASKSKSLLQSWISSPQSTQSHEPSEWDILQKSLETTYNTKLRNVLDVAERFTALMNSSFPQQEKEAFVTLYGQVLIDKLSKEFQTAQKSHGKVIIILGFTKTLLHFFKKAQVSPQYKQKVQSLEKQAQTAMKKQPINLDRFNLRNSFTRQNEMQTVLEYDGQVFGTMKLNPITGVITLGLRPLAKASLKTEDQEPLYLFLIRPVLQIVAKTGQVIIHSDKSKLSLHDDPDLRQLFDISPLEDGGHRFTLKDKKTYKQQSKRLRDKLTKETTSQGIVRVKALAEIARSLEEGWKQTSVYRSANDLAQAINPDQLKTFFDLGTDSWDASKVKFYPKAIYEGLLKQIQIALKTTTQKETKTRLERQIKYLKEIVNSWNIETSSPQGFLPLNPTTLQTLSMLRESSEVERSALLQQKESGSLTSMVLGKISKKPNIILPPDAQGQVLKRANEIKEELFSSKFAQIALDNSIESGMVHINFGAESDTDQPIAQNTWDITGSITLDPALVQALEEWSRSQQNPGQAKDIILRFIIENEIRQLLIKSKGQAVNENQLEFITWAQTMLTQEDMVPAVAAGLFYTFLSFVSSEENLSNFSSTFNWITTFNLDQNNQELINALQGENLDTIQQQLEQATPAEVNIQTLITSSIQTLKSA